MSALSAHIRGRNSLRNALFNQPSLLPTQSRSGKANASTRPRSLTFNPLSLASPTSAFADPKKSHSFFLRIPSSGLTVSIIALAFFVFGVFVSSTISTVLLSPRTRDFPLSMTHDQPKSSSSFPAFYPVSNITTPSLIDSLPPVRQVITKQSYVSSKYEQVSSRSLPGTHITPSLDKTVNETHVLSQPHNASSILASKLLPYDLMNGRVSWNRSWPISSELDNTNLIPLANALHFNNRTMLNYFHMHKTGGVTLKSEVMAVINNPQNKANAARRGNGLRYAETCYELPQPPGAASIEGTWRCDFDNIRKLPEAELMSVDIIMGHQYWDLGAEALFSKYRQIRPFSIFRHPLPRKLSFFYHFFIRNLGREETEVDKDEVIKFLLGEEMPDAAATRDAGPNYYASRMVSDGVSGFIGHRYDLNTRQGDEAISSIASKLQKNYALVGLQIQHEASQCMLEKLIQVFAHARGIDDLVGTPKLSFHTAKLNSGGYPWTSEKIWKAMTAEQRKKYKQVERVDLAIYDMAVRRFKEDVKLFTCEEKVIQEAYLEDVFE